MYETFKSEQGYNIEYYKSEYKAFTNWLQGLPSCFNIDFENYRIIELAKLWGSIPQDADDKQEDKILESWFNFITVKTFTLLRRNKIVQ